MPKIIHFTVAKEWELRVNRYMYLQWYLHVYYSKNNVYIVADEVCISCNSCTFLKKMEILSACSLRSLAHISGWSKGGGGRNRRAPPKIGSTFLYPIFIRMLKNKAQIAWESIKTTLELPGPWPPAESEFGSALVMCVLAHNHPRGGGGGYFHMYAYWIMVCSARETPIFSPEFPFRSISFSEITKKMRSGASPFYIFGRILPFRRPSFSKFL